MSIVPFFFIKSKKTIMKKSFFRISLLLLVLTLSGPVESRIRLTRVLGAGSKAFQAVTLTDEQVVSYVRSSVESLDANNQVLPDDDPYVVRLGRLTQGLTEVDGIPLNFKVYKTDDVNAFACADGSVRVFSSLMDLMSDDELLGIIGHEVGHVARHHTRNSFKNALLTDALRDGLGSVGGVVAVLTDSQLGSLGQALASSKYSRKQEHEADDYGYDFLKSHDKNPWGMVMAFEKFQGMEAGTGTVSSYVSRMFSSHPETQARIKRMKARCEKDHIQRPSAAGAQK